MNLAMTDQDKTDFYAALEEGANQLERLNITYPNLASDFMRDAVEEFRRKPITLQQNFTKEAHVRINTEVAPIETASNNNQDERKLIETAKELLAIHSFDDVLDILEKEHGETLNLVQLASLVGNNAYMAALRREAKEFRSNAISIPQIAQLWTDFGRPAIGDTGWTTASVTLLLE
jgi:hypothetical protein